MLQVGSGLPPGHVILDSVGQRLRVDPAARPSGNELHERRGRPGHFRGESAARVSDPTINGHATDVLTVLMADNAFLDVPLTVRRPAPDGRRGARRHHRHGARPRDAGTADDGVEGIDHDAAAGDGGHATCSAA